MPSSAQAAIQRSEPADGHLAADGPAASADAAVAAAGRAAQAGAVPLRLASADTLDAALVAMAARLRERAASVLAANGEDVRTARADGLADAFVDRLALTDSRIESICGQLCALAHDQGPAGRA